jgi:hypothetical protein
MVAIRRTPTVTPFVAGCIFPSWLTRSSSRKRNRATSGRFAGRDLLSTRSSNKSLALGLLASELASPTDRVSLSPVGFFGRLFIKPPALHLAKNTFPLHLLLEHPKSLVDIVVANDYLQETFLRVQVARPERIKRHRRLVPSFGSSLNEFLHALHTVGTRCVS